VPAEVETAIGSADFMYFVVSKLSVQWGGVGGLDVLRGLAVPQPAEAPLTGRVDAGGFQKEKSERRRQLLSKTITAESTCALWTVPHCDPGLRSDASALPALSQSG
jgi:hypothetical protein